MAMFGNVGLTLTLLRELRGKTQARLARDARIGKSQLSKYENGKELPKLDSLEKLLRALKISYLEFFYTLAVFDRRAAELNRPESEGAEAVPSESSMSMPPHPAGQTLLSEGVDAAFRQLSADLMLLHGRVLEQTVLSGLAARGNVKGRR